ncbi:Mu transposase domain-containing protein [Streptomyces sp. SAT1]|uniref:Mu transposase domain-containing protein n=1 Tax=Streptomyces sp. SAT1 TaxID=1849967 RepID=UPI003FCDF835
MGSARRHRRIGSRPRTVDEYFAVEQPLLTPLPQEPFETGRLFTPRVDRYSEIAVRTNRYSVPTRLSASGCASSCAPLTWWFTTRTSKWLGTRG